MRLPERLRAAFARARPYVEHRALAAALLAFACAWAFAELAEEMLEGETHALDTRILLALRAPGDPADPLGPPWFEELMRDVTGLGGVGILAAITLAAAGYLWLRGRRGAVAFLLVSVGGGQALSTIFKAGFDRPRPDLVPHGTITYTSSFPSGHAMMATVTYLTLAALLARSAPSRRIRAYIVALAVLASLAIGASRIYLGVHWPTDVLAGWTAGAAWALLCSIVAGWLQRRGMIEPESPGEP